MRTAFEVSQDWGDGLVGSFVVENDGETSLEKWVVSIETTFDIERIWGAEILQQVDNRYVIGATTWNANLHPGKKTKFGFVGRNATAESHQVKLLSEPTAASMPDPPAIDADDILYTNFEVSENWGNGLVGFIHLENQGAQVLDDWVFTFETTFDIETLWGGEILSREGNQYTVRAKGWNSRLDPGEKTKFGFVGRNATADNHQVNVIAPPKYSLSTTESRVIVDEHDPSGIESVEFAIAKDWWNGFTANLSFTYTGNQPLETWQLQFESQFEIVNLWHGELLSHHIGESGLHVYTISNTNWNGTLLSGDTLTIGFKGQGSSAHNPLNYSFNGVSVNATSEESVALDLPQDSISSVPPDDDSESQPENGQLTEDFPDQDPPAQLDPLTEQQPIQDSSTQESVVEEQASPEELSPVVQDPEEIAFQESTTIPAEEITSVNDDLQASSAPVEQSSHKANSPDSSIQSSSSVTSSENSPSYGEVLQKSLLFYEAQRSGDLPNDNRIAWRGDSALQDGQDVGVDLKGGYYDAGDHVKFGFPMAGSTTLLSWGMLEYRDAYVQSGQMDEALATIKWATDYFLKAHITDEQTTQAFYGQVGDPNLDHQYWGPAESLAMPRPAYKIDAQNPGSDLAAETAAALASASLLFRTTDPAYAEELLTNAKQLYAFADKYRGRYSDSITQAKDFYNSWSGYADELAWGAAWLYKATGDEQYLQKAEANYQHLGTDWTHNWDDKSYGTGVLLAQITDKALYRSEVETWLNNWISGEVTRTEGGLAWINQWGSLRYSANTALLAGIYSDTVNRGSGQFDQFSRSQIDYILGDNPAQQSYVAGIGDTFPTYIHHRSASGTRDIHDPAPNQYILYGALVGGPTSANDLAYGDQRTDFLGNEVALDYNAGFTGAVARLYGQEGGQLLSDNALIALSETNLSTVV
ncbi:MAG: glycoside hydrolase family 9 protein [Cyanobacteria bacterium J06642_11]